MVTHSSILTSNIAGTEMPYGLQSWGLKELEHSYTHILSLSLYIILKKCKHMVYTYMLRYLCMHICVCIYIYMYISTYICMYEWVCVFYEFNPKDFPHYDYDSVI